LHADLKWVGRHDMLLKLGKAEETERPIQREHVVASARCEAIPS
jgi:hypothetical protein